MQVRNLGNLKTVSIFIRFGYSKLFNDNSKGIDSYIGRIYKTSLKRMYELWMMIQVRCLLGLYYVVWVCHLLIW
jgi:hypothetical protein